MNNLYSNHRASFAFLGVLMGVFVIMAGVLVFNIVFNNKEPQTHTNLPIIPDTLRVVSPCPEQKIIEKKPLPSITKYKVSDIVCAWGRWTGVINKIDWSSTDPNILRYELQIYDEEDGWREEWYYDTELTLGKCD